MGVLIALFVVTFVVAFFLGGCILGAAGCTWGSAHRTRPEEPTGTAVKLDAPSSGKSTPRERTSSVKVDYVFPACYACCGSGCLDPVAFESCWLSSLYVT